MLERAPVQCLFFEPNQAPREVSLEEAVFRAKDGEFVWIHFVRRDDSELAELLSNELGFHRLAIDDTLDPHTRPELKIFETHLYFSVPRFVSVDQSEEFQTVGVFHFERAVVTVSQTACVECDRVLNRVSKNHFRWSPSFILHEILDEIIDSYFPLLDQIEDEIDDVTDRLFAGSTKELKGIVRQRRRLQEIRRRLSPLRDVLNSLLRRELTFISPDLVPYFSDLYHHTLRLAENVDSLRETLAGLADIHLSNVSNSLNQIMRKLTVISTVLMTASLVAGIYGMNLIIPETQWLYGYPFAIGLMVILSVGVLALFRWRRYV